MSPRENRAAGLENKVATPTRSAAGLHESGPFYRDGWLREKLYGVCAHTRMEDVDDYNGNQRNFTAQNNPLPDNYASRTALMVRDRPNASDAYNSRVLVTSPGDGDDAWTRDASRLPFFRFKDFDFPYNAKCDTAIHLNRVESRRRGKEFSKLAYRSNSKAYNTNLNLFDRINAKHREPRPGRFRHLAPKSRRTVRRKCRRAMARKGAEQVGIFTQRIRKMTEAHRIDFCDFSPLEDYIDGMREETTDNFRTWLFSVSSFEFDMNRTCLYRLQDYGSQYRGMGMRHHAAFCATLSAVIVDYEQDDPSSRYHLDRAEKMAKQFLYQQKLFNEFLQHSESYRFINGLIYGHHGDVQLRN